MSQVTCKKCEDTIAERGWMVCAECHTAEIKRYVDKIRELEELIELMREGGK